MNFIIKDIKILTTIDVANYYYKILFLFGDLNYRSIRECCGIFNDYVFCIYVFCAQILMIVFCNI